MDQVRIKYLNVYSAITGKKEEMVETEDGCLLLELLNRLFSRYGSKLTDAVMTAEDQLNPHIWLLVNQERVTDLATQVNGGDVVVFSFPVCGG
jgi:MoaD family protein